MNESILTLSDSELRDLATSLRAGRITTPFSAIALQRIISPRHATAVAQELEALRAEGTDVRSIAVMLELLAKDRRNRPKADDIIDLVTTGPEACGVTNRDTSVVVRELFASAKSTVLIAGYAVYQGQQVFAALAERMDECSTLGVRVFLDIQRPRGDTSATNDIVRKFANRFVKSQWPSGSRLPETFYYPPSLELDNAKKSSLHAKCVVVDGEAAFVSSANFTEAAQERNVEIGVLVRSPLLADRITRHFDAMLEESLLAPLIFPTSW